MDPRPFIRARFESSELRVQQFRCVKALITEVVPHKGRNSAAL